MENKRKKMIMMASVIALIVFGLLSFNGCKKSEPESNSANQMQNDAMADHDMSGMADMSANADMQAAPNGQTICPVMGEPINTDVFVEYEGKKVYFCCGDCEAKFLENPEDYIAKLPQFSE